MDLADLELHTSTVHLQAESRYGKDANGQGGMISFSPSSLTTDIRQATLEHVKRLITEHNSDATKTQKEKTSGERDKNIFTTMLNADIAQSEKTAERLNDEGFVMVVAGGETTSRALTNIVYYLLLNPRWLAQVRGEVEAVMPEVDVLPDSSVIEQRCPTLIASMKEVLRLVPAVTNRLQLYDDHATLQYKDWVIPAGTPISMSVSQLHLDPHIFENPLEFNPGRWLGADASRLNHYYVPFSKGSRSCLGLK